MVSILSKNEDLESGLRIRFRSLHLEPVSQAQRRSLAYTAVRFLDREDKRKREIVPSSMLVSQPGEFVALLAGRGYLWPPYSGAAAQNPRGAVNRKAMPDVFV